MADEKGRAVGELVGSPPPKGRAANDGAPLPCISCGAAHGSVGVHIHCLGNEILRIRRVLVANGLSEHVRR